jgi:hypothetical protein
LQSIAGEATQSYEESDQRDSQGCGREVSVDAAHFGSDA